LQNSDLQRIFRTMSRALIAEVESQIGDLNRRIDDLEGQKEVLERMLRRLRNEDEIIRRSNVTRKNSVDRILVENAVLRILETAKRQKNPPVPTKSLRKFAQDSVPRLHPDNFRSILHRMKERGVIISGGRGRWILPSQERDRDGAV
jgi:hypothetical protein